MSESKIRNQSIRGSEQSPRLRSFAWTACAALVLCAGVGLPRAQAQTVHFSAAQTPGGNITSVPARAIDFGTLPVRGGTTKVSFTFAIDTGGLLGTPAVLTEGAPNLDFTPGANTCTGTVVGTSSCMLDINFTPRFPGLRRGAVQIKGSRGEVLSTTYIRGMGIGAQAAFALGAPVSVGTPQGGWDVDIDGAGNLLVAAGGLMRLTPGGVGTTIANGFITGIAMDGAGNIFAANQSAPGVLKISPDGTQTVLGADVLPAGSCCITVDSGGTVYALRSTSGLFRITPNGSTPISISLGWMPRHLAADAADNIYLVGAENLQKISPAGTVTDLTSSGLGITVNTAGNLLLARDDQTITELSPDGTVLSRLAVPFMGYGLTVDSSGNIFVANNGDSLKKISRPQPALKFAATPVGSTSSDSSQPVTIQNIGNAPLQLTGLNIGTHFTQQSGSDISVQCAAGSSLAPGASCTINVGFTPKATGAIQGVLVLTSNSIGENSAVLSIPLTGTGLQAAQTITFAPIAVQQAGTSIALSASSTSGLPVSFTSSTPAVCGVSGATATLLAGGACTITASQAGNAQYSPAASVPQTFLVNQARQTITFAPIPAQVAGKSLSLSASASSGLSVSFVPFTPAVCTVSGTMATFLTAGTCSLQASQAGNAAYTAATPVTQNVMVSVAAGFTITPTPSSLTITRGTLGGFILQLKPVNGFKDNVKLTCSGGPSGSYCANLPQTVHVEGTAYAVSGILFPPNTPPGTYTITFTGVAGSATNTATAKFIVQ